jgi:membrane-bound serine protease (ClpP class)
MTTETIIALIVAGFLLLFFEVFIPGGVLGLIGSTLVLIGIVGGFIVKGAEWGFASLLISLIAGMTGFFLWVKYFPKSRFGKKLILQNDAHEWQGFDGQKGGLVGKEGVAHTPLRPAGTAIIDKERIDVVTRGEMIDARTPLKVIAVEGNRVVVTATAERPE